MLARALWRTFRGGLLGAGLLLAGCGVSPQPEPPSIDVSLISFATAADGGTLLEGNPGAVKPGGGTLSAIDLDGVLPEASVAVGLDGTFQAPVGGTPQHVFRVQAILDAQRSAPVDVTSPMGISAGPAQPVVEPLPCLAIDPALEVGPLAPGASATVTLVNGCGSTVTVGGFALRLASPAWSVTAPATPLVLPAHGASAITVTFDPHPGDARDDVLFVQLTAPTPGRRALTLLGQGP